MRVDRLYDRLQIVEDDLFDAESRDDRLTRIENRIGAEELARKLGVRDCEVRIDDNKEKLASLCELETNVNQRFDRIHDITVQSRNFLEKSE